MCECISIHIGQAGIRMGGTCWELFCLEHGIHPDGRMAVDHEGGGDAENNHSFCSFFTETEAGKYIPRAIFVDSEPSICDEFRSSIHKETFQPEQFISGKDIGESNFARGYYSLGHELIDSVLERIRKLTENCTDLQGFMIYHSTGGGTGSGFNALLLERLSAEYDQKTTLSFTITPHLAASVVESYNHVLSCPSLMEYTNCTFCFDNEALYDIYRSQLAVEQPSYIQLNHLIAQVISSITASMRFDGYLNKHLSDFTTNLVPFPRLHFLLTSYAPIRSITTVNAVDPLSYRDIVHSVFHPSAVLVKCDPIQQGKYMASSMIFRGNGLVPKDVSIAVGIMKSQYRLQFVDWVPNTGFKCGINAQSPIVLPGSELAPSEQTITMISNNTAIREVFARINHQYDVLYAERAYVHSFLEEGMEEGEFITAREELVALEEDYLEVCSDADETMQEPVVE
jgi:tubulin alpha